MVLTVYAHVCIYERAREIKENSKLQYIFHILILIKFHKQY